MGTVIGAIASGRVAANPAHTDLAVWTGPTSLLIGALFVAVCAYLAAVFLTREASRREDHRLRRYFALRAAIAAAVSGVLSLVTLLEIRSSNPALYHGLTHRALPLVIVAAACGLAVLALLATGRAQGLRTLSVLGVAAVVWGWGVAQSPVLLPGTGLTLTSASAPHSVLVTIVVIFVAAACWSARPSSCCSHCTTANCSKGNNMRKRADETRSRTLSPSLGSRSRPKIRQPDESGLQEERDDRLHRQRHEHSSGHLLPDAVATTMRRPAWNVDGATDNPHT